MAQPTQSTQSTQTQTAGKIKARRWFGREIISMTPAQLFNSTEKAATSGRFLCEYIPPKTDVRFYIDWDQHLPIDTDQRGEVVNDELRQVIRGVFDRFGVNRATIVDFQSEREEKGDRYYKFSKHIVFPDVIVNTETLAGLDDAATLELLGDYPDVLDASVYRKSGIWRQWMLKKPAKSNGGLRTVAGGGNAYEYKIENGEEVVRKLESTPDNFALSLVTYVDGEESSHKRADDWVASVCREPEKRTARRKTRAAKTERVHGGGDIDKFLKMCEMLNEDDRGMISTMIKTLYALPPKYAGHDDRMRVVPIIKDIEATIRCEPGALFIDWLGTVRRDLSNRDYLDNYIKIPYTRERGFSPYRTLMRIKDELGLVITPTEVAISNAQDVFVDRTKPPTFDTVIGLFNYITVAASREYNNDATGRAEMITKIFAHVCMSESAGEDTWLVKTLSKVDGGIVYESVPISARNPLNRRAWIMRNKKDKKTQKVALYDLFARHAWIFTKSAQHLGPFADTPKNVVNVSPVPPVNPEIRNAGEYASFVSRFKEYFYRVFLSGEDDKDAVFDYVMAYFREIMYGGKTEKVLIITDPVGGYGKTLMMDVLAYVMGNDYVRVIKRDISQLANGFNEFKEDTRVCVIEESGNFDNSRRINLDILKEMVTARTLRITRKYKETIERPNRYNWIILSNNNAPILVDESDRRVIWLNINNPFPDNEERKTRANAFADDIKTHLAEFAYYLKAEAPKWKTYRDRVIITSSMKRKSEYTRTMMTHPIIEELAEGLTGIVGEGGTVTAEGGYVNFTRTDLLEILGYKYSAGQLAKKWLYAGFEKMPKRRFTDYLDRKKITVCYRADVKTLEDVGVDFNLN